MEGDSQAPVRRRRRAAVVCDVEGGLLRSSSCFPYFMLVALEGGSFLRALLLLLVYPLLSILKEDARIRAMTLIAFCGVSACSFRVGATVLPKHLLEDVGEEGFRLLMETGEKKVCVSRMPKLMVEEFLSKYLGVDMVVARELKVTRGYFTGFLVEEKTDEEGLLAHASHDDDGPLGFCSKSSAPLHPLISRCKEVVWMSKEEKAAWRPLPREEYRKPLIFHDGRLAFRPTPLATTAMFVWLPFGIFLAFLRAILFLFLPYGVSTAAVAFTGMKNRLVGSPFPPAAGKRDGKGRLFICNHRTQVDPIWVSAALGKRLISLVYGISASTRLLSPLRTVVLRRVRDEDKLIIAAELRRGDVALCPEGTTCREPFVLRFSPLIAELVDEIHAVALSSYPSMFHGTTVNGRKALDPFVLLANPYVFFTGEFLQTVPAGPESCSVDVVNRAQAAIAGALGFRCSTLARKDKYRYLAGTDGVYPYKP